MIKRRLFTKSIVVISALFTLSFFAGCESADVQTTPSAETEISVGNDEEMTVELIKAGEAYDLNDRCKVAETYDTYNCQVPAEKIASECLKDSYESMTLESHSVELNNGVITDSAVLMVQAGNVSGLTPQTIKLNAVFESTDGKAWSVKQSDWEEWNVETKKLSGSNWYIESAESIENNWFSSKQPGEIYIHFKNNLNYIAIQKAEDADDVQGKIATKFNGSVTRVNGGEREEVSFSSTEGRIDDEGNFEFLLTTENGEGYLKSNEFKNISQLEYDVAFSDNPEELLNLLTLDKLSTFSASSESLKDGEWVKETGSLNGNVSPELTWDEVDGATRYAILMMDPDAGVGPHVHWYVTVEGTHVDAGSFDGEEEGYVGPHPPRTHEYDVYVFALKDESSAKFIFDAAGEDIDERARRIDEKVDGESGNIISYAMVSGVYTYNVIY